MDVDYVDFLWKNFPKIVLKLSNFDLVIFLPSTIPNTRFGASSRRFLISCET